MIHAITGAHSNPHWPAPMAELSCSPPAPSPEAIKCGEPPSASLPHFLRVLFDGFLLFRLLPFFFCSEGELRGKGYHTSLSCPSLSTFVSATGDTIADVVPEKGFLLCKKNLSFFFVF